MTLAWTDLKPDGDAATPAVLGAFDGRVSVATLQDWNARAPAIREALQEEIFGYLPDAAHTRILSHKTLNENAFGGKGVLEEYKLAVTATFNGVSVETTGALGEEGGRSEIIMDVVLPKGATGPSPVILMETFCPRWDTLPDPAVAGAPADMDKRGGIETYIFGRFICTPPVETILDAGYAIATIFPSEFVPDSRERGLAELARLSPGHGDDETRWGAVAAWAWAYSRMIDVLEEDAQIDQDAIITWGHSRYGKSALLAAAFDERIDGVIAHQSGTGGASLNRRKKGESVKAITNTYPHWFSRRYAGYGEHEGDMEIDQHHLLALIAPRPILLGNARRDVWSDPNGAFRAAIGADPAYQLAGSQGLEQDRLDVWKPDADIAFWIRAGTHGVVKEDWPAFLEFLDAHFSAQQ
ncbi:MAG: acetylxylan esterase [Hyphococcus sp.]|nr:MAG: acetylxylan esterase [Marinicaulis sp.]